MKKNNIKYTVICASKNEERDIRSFPLAPYPCKKRTIFLTLFSSGNIQGPSSEIDI